MAYYNSLKSLGDNILQFRDVVEIAGIMYIVEPTYLTCPSAANNLIFEKLSISDKQEYCEKAYGYPPEYGAWPEYRLRDYKAATRVVINLFQTWELQKGATEQNSLITNDIKEHQESNTKLLPAKCNSVKQITIQKEITFNKL